MFLKGKSWMAQEYYNEYLIMKQEISELNVVLNSRFGTPQDEAKLIQEIARFKYVLSMLKEQGVDMADLILLSIGVDMEDE
jgi:hypothetical protein